MAAPKGNKFATDPNKPKRGQNKINKETKELLKKFVDENFETAIKDWESIEDKGLKVKLFIQFLPCNRTGRKRFGRCTTNFGIATQIMLFQRRIFNYLVLIRTQNK